MSRLVKAKLSQNLLVPRKGAKNLICLHGSYEIVQCTQVSGIVKFTGTGKLSILVDFLVSNLIKGL